MRKQILPALRTLAVLTVLLGLIYPAAVLLTSQVAFADRANGSLVHRGDEVVGSTLIGQAFSAPKYFHPRPSAAGDGYDATASSASNKGPLNEDLLATVKDRVAAYRAENGLAADVRVPSDAVTASGSGLDPEISIANARLQAERVARARSLPIETVRAAIQHATTGRSLGILGDPGVNVLQLNLALDATK